MTSLISAALGAPPNAQTDDIRFGVVRGEGIGPSVIEASLDILRAAAELFGRRVSIVEGPELESSKSGGLSLNEAAKAFYLDCAASQTPILHGPAGGRFVYDLRSFAQLFVKLTPVTPLPALENVSLLRPERIRSTDMVIVRDNLEGAYQGDYGFDAVRGTAFQTAQYSPDQVRDVLSVALRCAAHRRGHLTVITKPGGVPAISELWRQTALELNTSGVELTFMEVDNACFQLGANPSQFDVIAAPNLFGDVVSDTAAITLGSRGLSYSANFSASGFGVFQTAHGAAHNLTGRNEANPMAQIQTMLWMLNEVFGQHELAQRVVDAVDAVLRENIRTADIAAPDSRVVTTSEFSERVISSLADPRSTL